MKKVSAKDTLAIYYTHVKQYPKLVVGALLAIPITTLLNNFLPPLIAAGVINRLSQGDYTYGDVIGSFGPSLVAYIVVLVIGVFGWRLVDIFIWPLEAKILRDLARTIYNHLLRLSADFHANSFSGSLVSQTNKLLGAYVRISDTTVYGAMPLFWGLVFTSVILFSRATTFVIAFDVIAIIYITIAVFVTKSTREANAKHAATESIQTGVLADSITNVLAIKSYASQNYEDKRFGKFAERTKEAHYATMRPIAIQITTFAALTRVVQITALVAGVIAVVKYNANLATVFLIVTYSATIADQLFNFTNNSLRGYNRAFGDASDMTRILQLKPSITDPKDPQALTPPVGSIVFRDVKFTHDGKGNALFTNFNLELKPGERVGLVGHSGSGKTTMTRLLLRFSDVDSGQIVIDGQDIRSITQDDLHSKITYVPQEPLLFHRSLSENISYGKKNSTDSEIVKVSKLAHAHEFIKDLPQGYDTLVGERGVKLSGGQRQRIAIARAMIKDAPIVVLDEATSALDSESEKLIQASLWTLMENKTALVIAHRLSTVQKMDRIIVLDNGKIIEEGSHKELIRQKGKYAELWAHQSGGFIED